MLFNKFFTRKAIENAISSGLLVEDDYDSIEENTHLVDGFHIPLGVVLFIASFLTILLYALDLSDAILGEFK